MHHDSSPEAIAYARQTEREAKQWAREQTARRRRLAERLECSVLALILHQREDGSR